ncbi:MAG: archaellum operon transcriptional activator EarA family protein [Methanocella sp.]
MTRIPDKNEDGTDIGRIYRSLDNSNARRDVLEYLCSIFPEKASVDSISLATVLGKVDVIGSLVGYRLRYRKEDSLVVLGLASCTVSIEDGTLVPVYSATLTAPEIKDSLKEYAFRLAPKTGAPKTGTNLLSKLRDKLWKR